MNTIKINSINFDWLKYYLRCFIKIYFKEFFLIKTWQIWKTLHLISLMRMFYMQRRNWRTVGFQKGLDLRLLECCDRNTVASSWLSMQIAPQINQGRKKEEVIVILFAVFVYLDNSWKKEQLPTEITVTACSVTVWILWLKYPLTIIQQIWRMWQRNWKGSTTTKKQLHNYPKQVQC